ncbi:hypothetical protein ACN47E_009609 [Coniothyrium glycines]
MALQGTMSTCANATSADELDKRDTMGAENEYANLIQNRIRPFFPKFAAAVEGQDCAQREQGRCAVVEFAQSGKQHVTTFETATQLSTYLTQSARASYHNRFNESPCRRLFVLEDLPYHHVLSLGAHLRIPPSFFAGHWDDPSALAFNHRSAFEKCSLPHFRLRYATSNRVEVVTTSESGPDSIYAFDARVSRHLVTYSKKGLVYDEAKSHHALSFWSSPAQADGSWDAVLLVDPPPGQQVRCVATGKMYRLRHEIAEASIPKRFFFPELDNMAHLPANHAEWASACSAPVYASIFDDTLESFNSTANPVIATQDPMSVVESARKLVISTTIAYLRRRYSNLVKLQNSSHFYPQAMRHNYLASFSKSSCSSWSSEFFDFIVGSRAAMRVWTREMDENITALGLDAQHSSAPQWERDGWQSVKQLGCIVDETVGAFATGYLQFVTISEARVSNRNAHSLSRITVLTMLFIPLSTVASIFSMGGDFLPGETRAWVFWVVAIPVLSVLAYLYWYRVIIDACKRRSTQLLPLYAEKSAKE